MEEENKIAYLRFSPEKNEATSKRNIHGKKYPYPIPQIYIESQTIEPPYPLNFYDFYTDKHSIVSVEDETFAVRYVCNKFTEIKVKKENGDEVWLDSRQASSYDISRSTDTRKAREYEISELNLATLRLNKYTVSLDSSEVLDFYVAASILEDINSKVGKKFFKRDKQHWYVAEAKLAQIRKEAREQEEAKRKRKKTK